MATGAIRKVMFESAVFFGQGSSPMPGRTKLVNIWKLNGDFVMGGLISEACLQDCIREHSGAKTDERLEMNLAAAQSLWDDACAFSQPDYIGYLKVQVQKAC